MVFDGTAIAFVSAVGLNHFHEGNSAMSGKTDEIKGRVKEAAGAIADDEKLRQEGKADQAKGKVKEAIDKAAQKTKDAIDAATKK